MKCSVKREGNRVVIAGLEEAHIGAPGHNNSVMATLYYAMNAAGEIITYEYLMGVSGAVFRLQVMQPEWCPSAPHSYCGFNCNDVVKDAIAYELVPYSPKENDAEGVAKVRKAIVESIEKGIPALCGSEEESLVVGYEEEGKVLLVRGYNARKPGYSALKKWPWGFTVLQRKAQAPDRRAAVLRSLKLASELATTKNYEKYASGYAAYELWIAGLEDDARYVGKD